MRRILIVMCIFFAVVCTSQSADPVPISRESGMAILANLAGSSFDLSAAQESMLQNRTFQTNHTNQTGNNSPLADDSLWSWGRIPLGYEVSDDGTLISLAEQEWAPSI